MERLYKFFTEKNVTEQEMAGQLVQEMVSYAESSVCRRLNLLRYFGEEYPHDNCGCCDNCLNPKPRVETKEEMVYALETIIAMKQSFKAREIIDVMMGRVNAHTRIYRHNQLEQFGKGTDHDDLYWKAVLRQAVIEKLVSKEIELFGVLKMTPAGYKYIKNPHTLFVPCDHDYTGTLSESDEELNVGGGGSAAGDEALYTQLKTLLRSIAQKEGLAPYVIFDDRSIKDMTIQYPCNIEELSRCTGVGVAKAQKNGAPFVELIKRYVEENEIERPQDIVVRSAINKSGLKVYIINAIDRQMPLEDIADGKGLTMSQLLTEMEHILSFGTKLNIDYYIEANIEQEHQDVLLDYWHEAETDSLQEAYDEFSDDPDYTEEEIRLIRIKFLTTEGF